MAEILLFHHAQGQTPGFLAFVDELRTAGHTVHAPDVYEGKTFATLDEGVAERVEADRPHASLSRRSRVRSCSSIQAIGICSLTTACPTTTRVPPSS
jgi:dienelactone hydrolase